jgi:hypothetical protein
LTAIGALKSGKRGVDKLSKGLSNWGLAFAFNKGAMGVGCLAEGLKQRDAEEIAKIAGIAKNWQFEDLMPYSAPVVTFIFQNEKIFRPGRVESKVGDCIPGGCENRIVEFAFKVLSVFSKHYLVAGTA